MDPWPSAQTKSRTVKDTSISSILVLRLLPEKRSSLYSAHSTVSVEKHSLFT